MLLIALRVSNKVAKTLLCFLYFVRISISYEKFDRAIQSKK